MNIYLSIPCITRLIDMVEEDLETKLDYTFDKERIRTLLDEKKVFLIDTFSTFVPPATSYDESITLERLGVVAYLKTKELRDGFKKFLSHYAHKTIGIHSDSLSGKEFRKINEHWQLDNTYFFGYEYSLIDKKPLFWSSQKDFEKMIEKLHSSKKETLIVGDGLTDIKPAYQQNIDLLLIPSYTQEKSFDFRTLYQT